jgi:hypothetical protein
LGEGTKNTLGFKFKTANAAFDYLTPKFIKIALAMLMRKGTDR